MTGDRKLATIYLFCRFCCFRRMFRLFKSTTAAIKQLPDFVFDWMTCIELKANRYPLKAKLHSEIEESEEFCERSALCSLKTAIKRGAAIALFAFFCSILNQCCITPPDIDC
ncbi:MAG: hypothetical protein GC179_00470 [Anaerolineaceae bacterium]|nr:hypothetical protein [Anaerolineaceae bacterium]